MRTLLILLLLLANLMLFGANHQMFGPVPSAGLRNPAPLSRELNPSGMHVRPMAPGEYIDHPVVGPADPTIKVQQAELPLANAAPASAASAADLPAASATSASAPSASGAISAADTPGSAASAAAPAAASAAHKRRRVHHPHG